MDAKGNPKTATKPEKPNVEPKVEAEPVEVPAPKAAAPIPETEPAKEPEPKHDEPAPAPEQEAPIQAEKTETPSAAEPEPATETEVDTQPDDEPDVFKPVSQTVSGPQLKVVGKIELSSLNQQTRPRKKTKEERRNERIAKAEGSKRKRKRIGKEKVDIEQAGNQPAAQPQGKSARTRRATAVRCVPR